MGEIMPGKSCHTVWLYECEQGMYDDHEISKKTVWSFCEEYPCYNNFETTINVIMSFKTSLSIIKCKQYDIWNR